MGFRPRLSLTKIGPAPRKLEDIMGLTHVTVAVSNPNDRSRKWEGLFLVDTGAIDCLAPGKYLREIGISPEGEKRYELVDGSEVTMEFGLARIEFLGDIAGGIIIFGPDDCEPIDPKSNQLKRLPAVPLK
jgi:hypothetical protein